MRRKGSLERLPVGLVAGVFLVALPILEVGPTHLFHPEWPGHARLHEVWQLTSNGAISLVCAWMAFRRGETSLASLIALCVVAPFLLAVGLQSLYGGSLAHSDGQEIPLAAYVAVPVMAGLACLLLWSFARAREREEATGAADRDRDRAHPRVPYSACRPRRVGPSRGPAGKPMSPSKRAGGHAGHARWRRHPDP